MTTVMMSRTSLVAGIAMAMVFCLIGVTVVSSAVQTTQVIAITGDAAPNGNGTLSTLSAPVLNNAGQVAFTTLLAGTSGGSLDNAAFYRSDGTILTKIAREGDPAPNGNGNYSAIGNPGLNDAGQAVFSASLSGTMGGGTRGIFRGDGSSITRIVREFQVIPNDEGFFLTNINRAINSKGQVTFFSMLANTSGGFNDDQGFYRGDGDTITQIAREGGTAPDGNGSFSFSSTASPMNDAGQVAFLASFTGTSGGFSDDSGIFRGDGTTLTKIAREGDPAPDGMGNFGHIGFGLPAINNAGQAAFFASVTGISFGNKHGLFLGDGNTTIKIVGRDQPTPDGNNRFSDFGIAPSFALNDSGQAALLANLTGTSVGDNDNSGLFLGDGTQLIQIVREGDSAPDGNGQFADFLLKRFVINNAGQVALEASLTGTSGGSSDDFGIFFYDHVLGLLQVARLGDPFFGSTITELGFSAGLEVSSGLNEPGQIAYSFTLADGREGIVLWTPPLLGDLNGDGFVGIDDLTTLLSNWNQNVSPGDVLSGDANGDGFVGVDDLNLVLTNWNIGTPPDAEAIIPEPGAAAMILVGVGLILSRRGTTS